MFNLLKRPLFSLQAFGWVFTPQIGLSLLFLMLLYGLIHLGFWQLHRAEFKKALAVAYHTQAQLPAQRFNPHRIFPEYAKVKLRGYYDNQHQFLLDNRSFHHQAGFEVLTPFIIPHQTQRVLINRGWVPRRQSRLDLPKLAPVKGLQEIEGLIKQPPRKSFVLAPTPASATWPQVIEALQPKEISQLLNKSLYPSIILLSPRSAHGFERHWIPDLGLSAERHVGYAIQWFALALTLAIIGLAISTHRAQR